MSVWDTVVNVAALATFLLLCTSITFYTIFQGFYLSRAPVQRTVVNGLVVNLSLILELIDILLSSTILLPYLLPMAEFMTQHPLIACAEGLLVYFLGWAISVSLAAISIHRLLSTLCYGLYEDWSQSLMLGTSLTVVYGYPLLGQILIGVLCHSGGVNPCSLPTKMITAAHNNTDVFSGMELEQQNCRTIPTVASFVVMLAVVVIATTSTAIISFRR